MKQSYKLFTAFGIPIRIHSSLMLLFPVMIFFFTPAGAGSESAFPFNPYFYTLLLMLGLFVSIALHELGHSLVGIKCGYRIKEIVLMPIGGVAKISHMTSKNSHEIMVAIAGPIVSILLSATLFFFGRSFYLLNLFLPYLFCMHLALINLVLALFNLIPSFPMDGGRVLRAALAPRLGRLEATRRAAKTGQILALAFGAYAVLMSPNAAAMIWRVMLAVFIHRAASAEYRAMQLQAAYSKRFGWQKMPPGPDLANPAPAANEIEVGPPPYAKPTPADNLGKLKGKIKNAFNL